MGGPLGRELGGPVVGLFALFPGACGHGDGLVHSVVIVRCAEANFARMVRAVVGLAVEGKENLQSDSSDVARAGHYSIVDGGAWREK